MKTKFLLFILLFTFVFSCSRHQAGNNSAYQHPLVERSSFPGNDQEYAAFTAIIVSKEASGMSDEEYQKYTRELNNTTIQKGFIKDFHRRNEYERQPKEIKIFPIDSSNLDEKQRSLAKAGTYPRWAGAILVTNEPNASSSTLFAGHAGFVDSYWDTTESFPSGGVQRKDNDWEGRYKGSAVYGIYLISTTNSNVLDISRGQEVANLAYAYRNRPYNFYLWDKDRMDAFYCSQLVYRVIKNVYNVDISNNSWTGVTPMDLYNDKKTGAFYIR